MSRLSTPWLLTILLLIVISSGCSNNDSNGTGVAPDFNAGPGITGTVVDDRGTPVEGVAIGLIYGFNSNTRQSSSSALIIRPPDKPAAVVEFEVPQDGRARVWVIDYAGDHVKTLLDGAVSAGRFSVMWNATDESGDLVPSGVYYFMVSVNEQTPVVNELFLMIIDAYSLMAAPNAVTDESGRFEITDNLIPVGETLQGADESGEITDEFTVSSTIRIMAITERNSQLVSVTLTINYDRLTDSDVLNFVLP